MNRSLFGKEFGSNICNMLGGRCISYSIFTRKIGDGRFQDVIENIPGLEKMGVKRLHLSPVYPQTCSVYEDTFNDHYYWPAAHDRVAEELGGEAGFARLLEALRRRGIVLVFDAVLTHFGYGVDSKNIGKRGDFPGGDVFRHDAYARVDLLEALEAADDYGEIVEFQNQIAKNGFYYLPTFNHQNESVRAYIIGSHKKFVHYGVRAFRIDSARHLPTEFIMEFCSALSNACGGETLEFYLEEACSGYRALRVRHDLLRRRLEENIHIYFYDFPLNGALVDLQKSKGSYENFMRFIREREDERTPLHALIPFVSNHDSVELPKGAFFQHTLHMLAQFFSINEISIFHGFEVLHGRSAARERIEGIAEDGGIALQVKRLWRELLPYRESPSFLDTLEYKVSKDTILVGKRHGDRRVFLFSQKSNRRFGLRLKFGRPGYRWSIRRIEAMGHPVDFTPDGDYLEVAGSGYATLVFEIVMEKVLAIRPKAEAPGKAPKVLMAAMEFTSIDGLRTLAGAPARARAGGLGKVVGELIRKYPEFLRRNGGDCAFIFPLYGNISREQMRFSFSCKVKVLRRLEEVKIFEFVAADGVRIFFASHPCFEARHVGDDTFPYEIYGPGGTHAEEARFLTLFNRAIADLYGRYGFSAYHGHDYQVALAPFYLDDSAVCVLSIHSAGGGFSHDAVHAGYRISPARDESRRSGNMSVSDFSEITGIDPVLAVDYFSHKGRVDILKGATKFLSERNGVGGLPVSVEYARELRFRWAEVLRRIEAVHGEPPRDPFKVFVPNGGVVLSGLYGVDNGADEGGGNICRPERKAKAKDDLIGKMLPKARQDHPVFVMISRLTEQKNFRMMIAVAEIVLSKGGAVVIAGAADASVPGADIARLRNLEKVFDGRFSFINRFVDGRLKELLLDGSDFTFIPSRFEPFGLTDIEFSRRGAVVIARKTGGLGKVGGGIYYTWEDSSNPAGEENCAKRVVSEAIDRFLTDPGAFNESRRLASLQRFSWDAAFERYARVYRIGARFKRRLFS